MVEGDGHLRLQVRDDGAGISPDAVSTPRSLGLLGMHERAHRLGGTLSVSGALGAGTTVVVDVPLSGSAARVDPLSNVASLSNFASQGTPGSG